MSDVSLQQCLGLIWLLYTKKMWYKYRDFGDDDDLTSHHHTIANPNCIVTGHLDFRGIQKSTDGKPQYAPIPHKKRPFCLFHLSCLVGVEPNQVSVCALFLGCSHPILLNYINQAPPSPFSRSLCFRYSRHLFRSDRIVLHLLSFVYINRLLLSAPPPFCPQSTHSPVAWIEILRVNSVISAVHTNST